MLSPRFSHMTPLLGVLKLLSLFLGHNFDMKVLKDSSGIDFEKSKRTRMRTMLFALVVGSYPMIISLDVVVNGIG